MILTEQLVQNNFTVFAECDLCDVSKLFCLLELERRSKVQQK